ncbi:Error-prone, lesion bypass DNA polymerase V (UmuC) [Pseudomonas synxantha]|uniref:Error-prone, lesion bypass DNA polymerase V (UmuC) n=1 Tax=Pseudomonas synxantha TaxID=47883 RepID=A0AAU8TRG8_9PSED|nr:Error-prone, lesion bypass DNA polymerase V (UmuC) [Pseudomonas synxantha]
MDALGRQIRAQVLRCTGIPVGVGIAHTKTLAKLANHTAKRLQSQTGGVVNITDPVKRDWVLRNTDVAEVWGVGRKMKLHLGTMGIRSAMDLAKADPWTLRKKFSVVIEKTARELGGTPCLELDEPDPPKQEICCSRMFGQRLTELPPIKEAVATYMMRASEKLRAQNSLCKKVRVSIRTGMFNPEEAKYANGVVVDMPYPTDDVRLLTQAAVGALDRLFRPGFKYSKAEVMLIDLCQPGEYTDDLFAKSQPAEATRVMTVLDQINERWGRGTLRSASVPVNPEWGMRREMMSQSYTTRLDQLWSVECSGDRSSDGKRLEWGKNGANHTPIYAP